MSSGLHLGVMKHEDIVVKYGDEELVISIYKKQGALRIVFLGPHTFAIARRKYTRWESPDMIKYECVKCCCVKVVDDDFVCKECFEPKLVKETNYELPKLD